MQKLKTNYKVIIVGGGASGLLCAVELLSGQNRLKGSDVLILEANDRVGKKLVATGNGQGNLCNQNFGAQFYHGEKGFVRAFVEQANGIDIQKYLFKLGIPLTCAKEGKMYPLSKQASAVLDIMRSFILSKGCKEITSCMVQSIVRENDCFKIETSNDVYYASTPRSLPFLPSKS